MREEIQHRALAWIKDLACGTGAFRVLDAERHGGQRDWDWAIEIMPTGAASRITLLVEAKRQLTPQAAVGVLGALRKSAQGGIPLLCCPRISPRVQQLCDEFAVGYLDETGNCRIAGPGLYIERRGREPASREEKGFIDPFAPGASRIIRAMLSEPGRGWQVQGLARGENWQALGLARWERSGVSLGLASRVKQSLLHRGFAVQRDRLLYVRDADDLLRAWAQNYRPRVEQIPLFVAGDPPRAELAIAEWCASHGIRYALTQFSGAWRAAPAVRYQRSTIYVQHVDDEAWEDLVRFNNAKRVDTGANAVLWRTYDPAVFLGERLLGDPPLKSVSALQLYLDLKQLHGRGEEAAQAVHEAEIAPTFKQARDDAERLGRTVP
jgi:hypothetical protein